MSATVGRVVEAARGHVEAEGVSACQVAVARHGELLAFETFGAAPASRFRIWSVTKPLVSCALLHLLAAGRVRADDPVARHVPEFTGGGKDDVTLEQVMVHTAGFPGARMPPGDGADPCRRRARLADWRLEYPPGSRFEYHSHSAHWVLAEVIERVTGTPFCDYVHERVTGPLGLPRLLGVPVPEQGDVVATDGAPSSERAEGAAAVAAGDPGGGGVGTAADVALFYQGVLRNPGGLWDPQVLADARGGIRCRLPEPIFGVPVNRTLAFVVAGDDGNHILRYALFGPDNTPEAFGHAGLGGQAAWADPRSGLSFCYLNASIHREDITTKAFQAAARASRLAAGDGAGAPPKRDGS